MNKRQFVYFLEVYKHKNFQTAADNLMISRQGLSKMIIDLEKELQQPLFYRNAKGLEPTKYAILLVPHIQKILDEFDFLEGKKHVIWSEKR